MVRCSGITQKGKRCARKLNKDNHIPEGGKYYCNSHRKYDIPHNKSVNKNRKVTESLKKSIAGQQYYKCANSPTANLEKLEDYKCPLWQKVDQNKGCFDQSGYEIDHIKERAITHNDTESNLQALCKSCHSVKTKKFLRNKNINDIIVMYSDD